ALVIVCLAGRQPWSQRKHRLSAAEGLDLSFLVDAEDHRVRGGIHVQAHNVVDFLFGLRVIAEFECLDTVRLESMSLPYPMNRTVRQSHLRRQISRTPMTHSRCGRLQGHRHHLRRFTRTDLTGSTAAW